MSLAEGEPGGQRGGEAGGEGCNGGGTDGKQRVGGEGGPVVMASSHRYSKPSHLHGSVGVMPRPPQKLGAGHVERRVEQTGSESARNEAHQRRLWQTPRCSHWDVDE